MIEQLSNFHFIRPLALLLVPLVVGLWWLWRRHSDPLRGWRMQMDAQLLDALAIGRGAVGQGAARRLLVGWLVAAVAIAGPTWRPEPTPFAHDATPLMILLKADISMEQSDPAPSRLERARLKIADLAEARKGQPLGLIAYAGSAHLVLPPTRDTAAVAQMAAEISPAIMPVSGDRLDLALLEAARVLAEGKQGGSIVVLADSVDTDAAGLRSARGELRLPIQFLSVNAPDSSQSDSVRAAAEILDAAVEPITLGGGDDVAAVVRRAARAPIAQGGEAGGQWQESGYWLVPLVALVVLLSFRRERRGEDVAT